jgi:fructosamine-3-kinase
MSLKAKLKNILDTNSLKLTSINGGDINEAYRVETEHSRYFLKYNTVPWAHDMFLAEKRGLELLGSAGALVPGPIEVFSTDTGAGLILQWMDTGNRRPGSWEQFGAALAILHRNTNDQFGLDHDNYIGRLSQSNGLTSKWLAFYAQHRIEPQLKMAMDKGLMHSNFIKMSERAFKMIEQEHPPVIPSLLHGDLWNGNLMFSRTGEPVFIDPAVYYGYREMDIAMMKLFGGFEPGLSQYNEILPLDPGWQNRLPFYQLYYILVHVNLFGGPYVSSALRILKKFGPGH